MTAPRAVSPILDGFTLDQPFSRHDGCLCCRVTDKSSGDPFVLKVISLPESATQMKTLLMAGAFPDRAIANAYFKEQARAILNESKTLQHMATLSGFVDFDSVQVVAAEEDNGFEVYLLSPQRTSLQQMIQQPGLTHLEVVNMALDVCTALSSCRHAGFFYVNLKPSNVFCMGQHYRIGDLGFLPLSAIGHAALPERYQNSYSPPELLVGGQYVNDSADVYALGLMLYQAYNGGQLPGKNDIAGQLLPPPKYADYEMAEIILRACAPDPQLRWNDPEQVRTALSRYLQRNGVRNSPIIAPQLRKQKDHTPVVEEFLPETYDESDFQTPLWGDHPPKDTPAAPETAPLPPTDHKKTSFRKKAIIAIVILSLILAAELVIGAFLLRSDQLKVDDFTASADGSTTILTIQCSGDTSDGWIVTYRADNGAEKKLYFVGQSVQIPALTPGTVYTFELSAQGDQTLIGQTRIEYTVPQS